MAPGQARFSAGRSTNVRSCGRSCGREGGETPSRSAAPEAYDVGPAAEDPGTGRGGGPERLRGATAHPVVARALRHTEREEGGLPIDGFPQAQPGRGRDRRIAATRRSAEAAAFVRFCYRRRRTGWPELYDEMCAVASRRLYNGWGFQELSDIGIGFSLFETPTLAALAREIALEEAERRARGATVPAKAELAGRPPEAGRERRVGPGSTPARRA